MQLILKEAQRHLLRLDKGEELMESLATYMETNGLKACTFSGIGTATEVELGFYNAYLKEYRRKRFMEDVEIISLNGNGALFELDGKPIIHAHGIFGRLDFATFGGHIFALKVSATCELVLTQIDSELKRKMDSATNLNILT